MSSNAADSRPGRRVAAWSITARLSLLYTLATAGILLASTGLLYRALVAQVDREDENFLADKLQGLRATLREPGAEGSSTLQEEVRGGARSRVAFYVRVLDAAGRLRLETPAMAALLPANVFPTPVVVGDKARPSFRRGRPATDRREFLLTAVKTGDGRVLQVGLDCTEDVSLFAAFRLQLAGVFAGGTLAAAGLGVWVARRSLQPLREITRAVGQVGASRLRERIGARPWPGELTALAGAFDGMLRRLDDSFARLSQLSADVAHELRTPIANLRGEAEVALARVREPGEYRVVLESALEEYGRLARMIDGLLFLARAESTEVRLAPATLDAGKETDVVLAYYEPLAQERGITTAREGTAAVRADPALLRRALGNLLANALRHTPAGGRVAVTITAAPDGAASLCVRDSGEGIAPGDLPRVFERFYRADRARSGGGDGEAAHGTGLGLSIVHSIMELHGGGVEVQSTPGEGATFTLRFPPPLASPTT